MASLDATYTRIKNTIRQIFNAEKSSLLSGNFGANAFEHFSVSKWTHDDIAKGFDRSALTSEYEKQFDAGKLADGDIYRIVLQHDFIASAERAYRIRCKNRCDILIGGASQAAGLASQGSPWNTAFDKLPLLCEPKP